MAIYSWNGAAGDYLDPAQWTPNDVPLYGSDTSPPISFRPKRLTARPVV